MTIHRDISFSEYRALPGWNWSLIKLLETGSPLHVKHAQTAPDNDTASRVKLRAIHCLVLEPHHFDRDFSVFDGTRRGKLYDAHCACHPGTAVLNPRELAEVQATATAIRNHPAVRPLLEQGHPEVSLTWTDPDTGLLCKARLDWHCPAGILDLKTIGTTCEREVARQVARGLYHGQLAHYEAGLRAHGIENARAFIAVAEGKGAQDVAVYELDDGIPDGALHVGRELRKRLLEQLAECVATDRWPGRHEEVQALCLPSHALLDTADEITFGDDAGSEEN